MMNLQHKAEYGFLGRFRVTKYKNGKEVKTNDWQENMVVSSDTYGRNLILRQMAGDDTYSIVIDGMALSTNNSAPANSDTSLGGTEVEVGIDLVDVSTSGQANVLSFSSFFTDGDLANGTYYKIGVYMNGRLFTSALLDTPEVKDTGEEFRIDYQISLN